MRFAVFYYNRIWQLHLYNNIYDSFPIPPDSSSVGKNAKISRRKMKTYKNLIQY
jgi:pectate lyase